MSRTSPPLPNMDSQHDPMVPAYTEAQLRRMAERWQLERIAALNTRRHDGFGGKPVPDIAVQTAEDIAAAMRMVRGASLVPMERL